MMEEYIVRWTITGMIAGALGVFCARPVAYWTDQEPWLIRGISYFLLAVGIVIMAVTTNVVLALKILGASVVLSGLMLWFDTIAERQEAQLQAERAEELLGRTERHVRHDASAIGPPPRKQQAEATTSPDSGEAQTESRAGPPKAKRAAKPAICPACQKLVTRATEFIQCPHCKLYHHKACWDQHGGCMGAACARQGASGH